MTEALQKLIENGGWRPIEEAPRDGTRIIARKRNVIAACRYAKINGWSGKKIGWKSWPNPKTLPTHFMPLDTPERMAKIIEVLATACEDIGLGDIINTEDECYSHAFQALDKANKIAEGKDD